MYGVQLATFTNLLGFNGPLAILWKIPEETNIKGGLHLWFLRSTSMCVNFPRVFSLQQVVGYGVPKESTNRPEQ